MSVPTMFLLRCAWIMEAGAGPKCSAATSSFLINMNIERLPVKPLSSPGGYFVYWLLTSLLGELS